MSYTEEKTELSTKELATVEVSSNELASIPTLAEPESEKPSQEFAGASMSVRQKLLLFIGLVLASFLASLDGTVVSTVLPKIATEFSALSEISWVATGYLLTYNACQPLYGKFSDIFGRKACLLFAIIVFVAASIGCGASTSLNMLIGFRIVAGIGGAGLMGLVMIVIADIFSLEERPKYQGIIWATFGLSSVVGPLLGGAFADNGNVGWPWAFYINGPVGAVAGLAVLIFLRLPNRTSGSMLDKLKRVDYIGTILLIAFVVCLLLPLTWGGVTYPWNSARVIALFVVFAVLLAIFVFVELKIAVEPVVPASIFRSTTVTAVYVSNFFVGMAFFGVIFYSPIFFQVVQGTDATTSGLHLIPMLLGLVIFSIASGVLIGKVRKVWPFLYTGSVLFTVGIGLLTTFNQYSNNGELIGYPLIIGAGLGFLFNTNLLAVQSAVDQEDMAIATALTGFFQSIGGGIGIAISSTILDNYLLTYLTQELSGIGMSQSEIVNVSDIVLASVTDIRTLLPANIVDLVIDSYVKSLRMVFLVSVPFAGLSIFCSVFVRPKQLMDPAKALEHAVA